MTVYNQQSCIEKCLESILNQTIKDVEIIVEPMRKGTYPAIISACLYL